MTAIQQNPVAVHHNIDDASSHSGSSNGRGTGRDRQTMSDSARDTGSSTINISYSAELRLRAYQEQRSQSLSQTLTEPGQAAITDSHTLSENKTVTVQSDVAGNNSGFPQRIEVMLSEVEDNIVQASEPGYRYLVNVLSNHIDRVGEQSQLQELMRREQYFLTRRKPFMDSSDFQSYSQVLGQFSNILERQQHSP